MPRRKKGSSSGGQGKSGAGRGNSMSINKGKPQQRNAANARERARMRVLSKAFCRLKTTLPWVPADTKLSKLDTLRLAASYIAYLKELMDGPGIVSSDENPSHPEMSLTWPFGFNRPTGLLSLGGNGSSCLVGGGSEGEDDEEEEEENSSGCWDHQESPSKDCIHLDCIPQNQSQTDLGKQLQMQLSHSEENEYKCHPIISNSSNNPDVSCNNNNLPYNFHHSHPNSNNIPFPYYHNTNDNLMSLS